MTKKISPSSPTKSFTNAAKRNAKTRDGIPSALVTVHPRKNPCKNPPNLLLTTTLLTRTAPIHGSQAKSMTKKISPSSPTKSFTNAAKRNAKTRDGIPSALVTAHPLQILLNPLLASVLTAGILTFLFCTKKKTKLHSTAYCISVETRKNAAMHRIDRESYQMQILLRLGFSLGLAHT